MSINSQLSKDNIIELGGFKFTYNDIEKFSNKFYQSLLKTYNGYIKIKDDDPLTREEFFSFFSIMKDFGLLSWWLDHKELHHPEPFKLRSDFQHYLNNFTCPQQDYPSYVKFKKKGAIANNN